MTGEEAYWAGLGPEDLQPDDLQQPHPDKFVDSVATDGTDDEMPMNQARGGGGAILHLSQQLAAALAEAQEYKQAFDGLKQATEAYKQLKNTRIEELEAAVQSLRARSSGPNEQKRKEAQAAIIRLVGAFSQDDIADLLAWYIDTLDSVSLERDQLRERLAWRPIETAPRDGTTVFVWWAGRIQRGAYLGPRHGRPISDWYVASRGIWHPTNETVYHWLPLPEPPKDAAIERQEG